MAGFSPTLLNVQSGLDVFSDPSEQASLSQGLARFPSLPAVFIIKLRRSRPIAEGKTEPLATDEKDAQVPATARQLQVCSLLEYKQNLSSSGDTQEVYHCMFI